MKFLCFLFIYFCLGYLSLDLVYNEYSQLLTQVAIGTPQQRFNLSIDTGSSDSWVLATNSTSGCPTCATFASVSSSTWKDMQLAYNMTYGTASAWGYMGTDNVQAGNKTVYGQQLAVIFKTDYFYSGILGIGPVEVESIYINRYPNFPVELVKQGIIHRNVYSLYAGDKESVTAGKLLFGAIDHAKYTGDLVELPWVLSKGNTTVRGFYVKLNQVTININNRSEFDWFNSSIPVLFDSGSSVTQLPGKLYDRVLAEYFGIDSANTPVPCNVLDTITYNLGDFEIEVPMTDNIFDIGDGSCVVGFGRQPTDDKVVFGIPVLQRIYTVFDIDNKKLFIAKAVQTDQENIEVIGRRVPVKTEHSTRISKTTTKSTSKSKETAGSSYTITASLHTGSSFHQIPVSTVTVTLLRPGCD